MHGDALDSAIFCRGQRGAAVKLVQAHKYDELHAFAAEKADAAFCCCSTTYGRLDQDPRRRRQGRIPYGREALCLNFDRSIRCIAYRCPGRLRRRMSNNGSDRKARAPPQKCNGADPAGQLQWTNYGRARRRTRPLLASALLTMPTRVRFDCEQQCACFAGS